MRAIVIVSAGVPPLASVRKNDVAMFMAIVDKTSRSRP